MKNKPQEQSGNSVVEADSVITAELKRIRDRRDQAYPDNTDTGDPRNDAVGLALSGGGVRSATFNLGVLQALQRYGVLKRVDYLSTVSGGGFIGSCLTWFMTANRRAFPFGERRGDFQKSGEVVSWLRQHGEYLAPGPPLNVWALAAGVLRGAFISLLAFLPVLFLIFWGLSIVPGPAWITNPPILCEYGFGWPIGFVATAAAGLGLWLVWLGWCLIYALRSSVTRSPAKRELLDGWHGRLLLWGFLLALVGTLPLVHDWLGDRLAGSELLATITGLIVMRLSRAGRTGDDDVRGPRGFLLHAGLLLALYGLFLGLYHLVTLDLIAAEISVRTGVALAVLVGPVLLLWIFADLNQISMLRFYRDRIVHAFLPAPNCDVRLPPGIPPHDCPLGQLEQTAAPYHIINTNLVTVNSPDAKRRLRCGENFILSPLFCGSDGTGYMDTSKYLNGTLDLATACAISGAAVATNTRFLRARAVSFLMTLFNLSLGFWTRNPRASNAATANLARAGADYFDALREMLGFGLHESNDRIHLTDGGHFENLGAYELIRRRCGIIVICDAGADPNWDFADLANLVQKVRVDFGAAIEIDTRPLRPRGDSRISEQPFVVGHVRYSHQAGNPSGPKSGTIVYIKTCVIAGLPEDIYGYRRTDPAFPDTPTANQFFNEARFEAYRELGYRIAEYTFRKKGVPGIPTTP